MNRVFESVSTSEGPIRIIKMVKKLKIKAYNEKIASLESLDRVNTTRLDLRRANKLNYSGIQTFGVLGSLCIRKSDDKLSRGVNL